MLAATSFRSSTPAALQLLEIIYLGKRRKDWSFRKKKTSAKGVSLMQVTKRPQRPKFRRRILRGSRELASGKVFQLPHIDRIAPSEEPC